MAEKAITYALTTKNRVKDRLSIKDAAWDVVFDRLIAAMTDFLEGECGGRRFLQTVYTNEVYSIYGDKQDFILLRNAPVDSASLTILQYRAGLKSSPNWTNFLTDDWELLEDGKSGIIKVYGGALKGVNAIRVASYKAGFLIDFENAGDITKHTLPYDLSDLAERLTQKLFQRKLSEGKGTESFEGGAVAWKELLDEVDKQIIARYRRLPTFV